ncbi:G5 domain-containing protein [Intestinibacillus massiliensis]|nr:G5 domain-containing protein [Intestinibacillus massiliensis]
MQQLSKQKCKARSRWLSAALLAAGATSMLTAMASQLNIYEVTDSVHTTQIKSFTDDALQACALAGYDEEDYALVADSGADNLIRTLRVERKFSVSIFADGRQYEAKAVPGTVREILAEQGVTLGQYDEVSPSADARMTAGTHPRITVSRVTKETVTERAAIPYKSIKRNTAELDYGQTRVSQQGMDGEAEQTVLVTKRDGVEVSREVQDEAVLREPQSEILEVGTGGAVVTRGGEILRYARVVDVKATAYSTEGWSRENKITATGTRCRVGAVAVDPRVIPLGSRLYITSPDGESWVYGTAVAEDTGGAIKGNRIDLYYNTQAECRRFGVRGAKVYVLS